MGVYTDEVIGNMELMLRFLGGGNGVTAYRKMVIVLTSCARGDTICLRPCKLTLSSHLFVRWHLFRHVDI